MTTRIGPVADAAGLGRGAQRTAWHTPLVMFLALREMRRTKARFGLVVAAVALLVFLIFIQLTLQNGLLTAFVGAIRNQSAPVLVYSVDGRRNLQGSVITPPLEAAITAVPEVGRAGRIGEGTFTATVDGDLADVALVGYEAEGLGSPTALTAGRFPERDGEVVANEADADLGLGLGDTVALEPGGLELTVVGQAEDINLQVTPTLFTTYDTYVAAVRSVNPDARDPLPNAIALTPAEGVTPDQLSAAVNAADPEADALPRAAAADETPGVAQVRQSFQVIFLLYALVVPLVTGLFFLIITFQKANALTLLRAVGAPARRLVAALLVQVVIVMAAGIALGTALYAPLSVQRVGSIPLRFETRAVVVWTVVLMLLGVLSSLFSARRVLRIDPVEATTGAGVQV
ncbi:MAG: peptide ABC transporter permease [Microthrixaceae bacterium]|nr:peptide ABC transporter permease [Microthrixaceae bacterium]